MIRVLSDLKYKKCCLRGNGPVITEAIVKASIAHLEHLEAGPTFVEKEGVLISDAILDLIDEMLGDAVIREHYDGAIALACAAWNGAEIPDRFDAELARFVERFKDVDPPTIRLAKAIMQKKAMLYPDLHCYIIDHELLGSPPDNFKITVLAKALS